MLVTFSPIFVANTKNSFRLKFRSSFNNIMDVKQSIGFFIADRRDTYFVMNGT